VYVARGIVFMLMTVATFVLGVILVFVGLAAPGEGNIQALIHAFIP
jgi:hypothetical protein